MACGEGRPAVTALVRPAAAGLGAAVLEAAVARANTRLPDYAQVRGWLAFDEAPSVANGLATANGRLRRDAILARYGERLERLHDLSRGIAAGVLHELP